MDILDVQNVHDNVLVVQRVTMKDRVVERIKQPLKVIGVCHDPVNDKVMLLHTHPDGSLIPTQRFPSAYVRGQIPSHEVITEGVKLATGALVKSAEFISSYLESPEYAYAPVHVYYVTFDSRTVEESDSIRMTTAKELYKEVSNGLHRDPAVISGAQYLKMRHHNLIK